MFNLEVAYNPIGGVVSVTPPNHAKEVNAMPELYPDESIKDIEGYEKLYAITSFGRVWSYPKQHGTRFWNGRWMKLRVESNGYQRVQLSKKNLRIKYSIHRLVAKAFITNPLGKDQVNHINGVKTDNNVENLEWMNASEQMIHAIDNGLKVIHRGEEVRNSKLTKKDIIYIRKRYSFGGITMQILADKFNVHVPQISRIINRKRWAHVE